MIRAVDRLLDDGSVITYDGDHKSRLIETTFSVPKLLKHDGKKWPPLLLPPASVVGIPQVGRA